MSSEDRGALLVGDSAGAKFIVGVLGTHANPDEAIEAVQRSGALRDTACEPLLGLLDHLGTGRADVRSSRRAATCAHTSGARHMANCCTLLLRS